MKSTAKLFCAFSFVFFCLSAVEAADTNRPAGFHLTVELQDGSRLIGKAGDENYQFRSDVLGEMKLPLGKIRFIECQSKTNSVRLTTSSGDSVSAQFTMKEIRIETAFGNVKLPANLLRQIQVSPMGGPAKSRPGLVALWSGEDNGSDSVGGNNAMLTDISFTAGKVGRAFVFNDDTSLFTVPASESLAVSNLTFEGWILPTDIDQPRPIIEYGGGGQASPVHLWINTLGFSSSVPGAIHVVIRDRGGANALEVNSAAGIVAVNQWHHVAFTYDTTTRAGILYCNGVQVGSAVSSIAHVPQSFCPVNLGYRDVNSLDILQGYRFAGLLDEIAIYNRALSTEEIKAIGVEENNGEPLPPPKPTTFPQRIRSFDGFNRGGLN